MDIEVMAPDVNESFLEFAVVPNTNKIRFGMAAIKNVGTGAVEEIIRARETEGRFKSLEDFFSLVSVSLANRKAIESLIKAGALDSLAKRSLLLNNLDNIMAYATRVQKQKSSGQTDLFGNATAGLQEVAPRLSLSNEGVNYAASEQLKWERELLGIYLSQHPLDGYINSLKRQAAPISSITAEMEGQTVTVGGMISEAREITTKNGQKMAFLRLADTNSDIELVLFPKVYQDNADLWQRDKAILVRGQVSSRGAKGNNGELKIIAESGAELATDEELPRPSDKDISIKKPQPTKDKRLYIKLQSSEDRQTLMSIKKLVDEHSGNVDVVLVIADGKSKQAIKLPTQINPSEPVIKQLSSVVGGANIKVE